MIFSFLKNYFDSLWYQTAVKPLQNHVLSLWPSKQGEMVSNPGEEQILFLLSGTCNGVPSSYIKLRSYLNIHLSSVAEQLNLNLPKGFRNRNKACPHCYSDWSTDTSSFKLLPTKKSKFSQTQNKIKKVQEGEIKESRNTLVLRCKVCTNKSLFSLVKKKPVKKIVKEESVKSVKKKKKKKDKSCGLLVHLKKTDNSKSEVSKKEKRCENVMKIKNPNSSSTHSQGNAKSPKNTPTPRDKSNSVCGKNKNLIPNPFALKSQGKISKKKDRKLQGLKNAIKAQKSTNLAKKTLKDFLNVI